MNALLRRNTVLFRKEKCHLYILITGDLAIVVHVLDNSRNKVLFLVYKTNVFSLLFSIFHSYCRHNGEVPSTRPKSDFEPLLPTKPKTLSGDWGEKSTDMGKYSMCVTL